MKTLTEVQVDMLMHICSFMKLFMEVAHLPLPDAFRLNYYQFLADKLLLVIGPGKFEQYVYHETHYHNVYDLNDAARELDKFCELAFKAHQAVLNIDQESMLDILDVKLANFYDILNAYIQHLKCQDLWIPDDDILAE